MLLKATLHLEWLLDYSSSLTTTPHERQSALCSLMPSHPNVQLALGTVLTDVLFVTFETSLVLRIYEQLRDILRGTQLIVEFQKLNSSLI